MRAGCRCRYFYLALTVLLSLRQLAWQRSNHQDHGRRFPPRVVALEEQASTVFRHYKVEPLSVNSVRSYDEFLSRQPWDERYNCTYPFEWQRTPHPTCNPLHEVQSDLSGFLGSGYWRQGWIIENKNVVLKRSRLDPPETNGPEQFAWGLHKSQVEAMVLDRIMTSKAHSYVLPAFAWCASSILVERADETFADFFRRTALTLANKLALGRDVARILYEIHSFDGEQATVAVADLSMGNILLKNNSLFANDFNQAILLKWDPTTHATCRYKRTAARRSSSVAPEQRLEYKKYLMPVQLDVYQLGNFLYCLLTGGQDPIHTFRTDVGYYIQSTQRMWVEMPSIELLDYYERVLYFAILACHAAKPIQRPSSFVIWKGLDRAIQNTSLTNEQIKTFFDPNRKLLK